MAHRDIEAVICIPSFRRPEGLRRTLASLAEQITSVPFAVIVVDNDAEGQAAMPVAAAFFKHTRLPGNAVVETQQGNCHAINTAFSLARQSFPGAAYFLMIDDDEAASPGWLEAMIATARGYGADIVGGPVVREFDAPVSLSISRHPLFGSIEAPTGPVEIIHGSGNCLISRRVFDELDSPSFDTRFNFLGGGDMDFFTRSRRAGFGFAWCAEAVITEFVATDRLSARWLMARSIRTGTINFTMDAREASLGRHFLLFGKNGISLGLSPLRAARLLIKTRRILPATHPILMSVGRIMGSFGMVPTPYKAQAAGETAQSPAEHEPPKRRTAA